MVTSNNWQDQPTSDGLLSAFLLSFSTISGLGLGVGLGLCVISSKDVYVGVGLGLVVNPLYICIGFIWHLN